MPRLRILAGPSLDELTPIEANSDRAVEFKSDVFQGKVAAYIKGFADPSGDVSDSAYFEKRTGVTWSIQVQGRFSKQYSADDVLFGNVFERPLKLPWGFSAALKFMNFVDPTLEQDLASSSKPWALSPLISTMPHLEHKRINGPEDVPSFPAETLIGDDISQLQPASAKKTDASGERRTFFKDASRRKEVVFGPEDLITADFCYDYLRFSPQGVELRLPGGITIDMMKYWDGQRVPFVCCERLHPGDEHSEPWGRVFWCIVIEAVDEDEVVGARGGDVD
ncbi:uncharacterized protein B0H18DRAFT_600935 [Fomitopsis serialis]|uniref:uncharacterized protein n=1 Tax=Fomitopsis serialis TaxID=139415 RepID=UPI002008C50B|nr:uncharacterized protein B0H18DRAFT_600935 [Neoantrodia serialis]KAH9933766.1 hypothetical protein B0H18DRAFT_600935 [Neoantrodia serialis]